MKILVTRVCLLTGLEKRLTDVIILGVLYGECDLCMRQQYNRFKQELTCEHSIYNEIIVTSLIILLQHLERDAKTCPFAIEFIACNSARISPNKHQPVLLEYNCYRDNMLNILVDAKALMAGLG